MSDEIGVATVRLGVLISGSGTNLQAIIDAIEAGTLDAEVALVISNRQGAYGLERARNANIPAIWIDSTACSTSSEYNSRIRDALLAHEVDFVVMAGYMKLLGVEVLDAFDDRVINIHPSLLPAFAGAAGISDAFEYGVKFTGVTVHFANERFDEGPIIAQRVVEILPEDTLESLEARIHEVEHALYPEVLQWLAQGRVVIEGRKTCILSVTTTENDFADNI
ncbi:MAG: phosphoribosylglycinamide formyltransferase [Actinobacteria bacterium]|nr:phosphoribosylglycinamide formyltransferase [Actinomycetota bacterium]